MEKVVVITGASSGIGLATAKMFKQKGYIVYNLARRTVEGINSISCDVTNRDNIDKAIEQILSESGRIDILVNNAGMGISGSIEGSDMQSIRRLFDVNFFGAVDMIKAVLPTMRKQNSGMIINMSSAGAPLSLPFQAFYSASKSALSTLTEALRIEVKPFNIKVTSLLPGDVKTDFPLMRKKNNSELEPYAQRMTASVSKMEHDELNGMPAESMAKYIIKLAESKNPPVFKVGGKQYALLVQLAKIMPKRFVNYLISKLYG